MYVSKFSLKMYYLQLYLSLLGCLVGILKDQKKSYLDFDKV